MVDELQIQIRQLAWNLRIGELPRGDLATVFKEYLEDWSERAGIAADLACHGFESNPIPIPVANTLYWVAQEALANAQRHSGARNVSVLLQARGGSRADDAGGRRRRDSMPRLALPPPRAENISGWPSCESG